MIRVFYHNDEQFTFMQQREKGNRRKYPISASLSVSNFIKIHIFVTDRAGTEKKQNKSRKVQKFLSQAI